MGMLIKLHKATYIHKHIQEHIQVLVIFKIPFQNLLT